MDEILELPDADVSKLQEQEQGEGTDDNSSADEDEGGLDWTKLPWVSQLFLHSVPSELCVRLIGLGLPPPGQSSQSAGTKNTSPHQDQIFRNITSEGLVLRCSTP